MPRVRRGVPVLDMRTADGGRDPQFVADIGSALEQYGFVVIEHHGLSPKLLHRTYEAMRELFAQPVKTLKRYETPGNGRQTGYTPPRQEKAKGRRRGDLKHFWHVRRHLPKGHPARRRKAFVPNIWPSEVPGFKSASLKLFHELDELAVVLLVAINAYLGLPEGTLPDMIKDGESLLRLLHYMKVSAALARKGHVRAAAHEDINLITLLPAATASGLQLLVGQGKRKRWKAVNETPGSIVVNVGDMLQEFTSGRLVSTRHRVVNPPNGSREDRYSIPYFVHPRGEVVLNKAGLTAGEFLRQRLIEIGLLKPDAPVAA